MNLDERNEQSPVYSSFRTTLDMSMGAIYMIMGVILFSMRYFGTVELGTTAAFVLGGIMVLYGAFRIYRGYVAINNRRRSSQRSGNR
jgi:hypothetical protein